MGRIVAVVNQEVITQKELDEALSQTPPTEKEPAVSEEERRRKVLSRLIEQRLILQKAKEMGMTVSDAELEKTLQEIEEGFPSRKAFEDQLAQQGLSLDRYRSLYRNQMTIKRMVDRQVRPRVTLSPSELKEYYSRHRSEFRKPERLHLLTLLIRHRDDPQEERKAQVLAAQLRGRLKNGESFQDLARQFSEGPVREQGGDLGWVELQNLLKEISEAVVRLRVGELTSVLETAVGYHLFRLEDREEAETISFRKVKPMIERRVWEEKMRSRYTRWVESLKKGAYIEIY